MKVLPAGITLKTPAKINLLLHIRGKRSDGYHDIVTVMQMVDLWDELIIENAEGLNINCTDPEVPSGPENLIYKAASILREYARIDRGAAITLKKVIPLAAGLGGGSSDAAAALSGLNILWGLGYTNDRLMNIGRELGSDVPFFLNGPAAIGYGRGDDLVSITSPSDYWFLLINPAIHVSTAWAYSQISNRLPESIEQIQYKVQGNHKDDYNWIGSFTRTKIELTKRDGHIKIPLPNGLRIEGEKLWLLPFNDLEEVVIKRYPAIKEIKEKMVACGARYSLMSGSGSTVFGIFGDRSSAERAYMMLQESGWRLWIVQALQSSPYSYNNYQT